jgi:integrase
LARAEALPPFVVEALEACPRISERYWFWTGVGSKETLAGNWRRTFRRLCEIAGVQGGHPHRFRDTLAVELLLEGTGEPGGTRTRDPLLKRQMLYRLSYRPSRARNLYPAYHATP